MFQRHKGNLMSWFLFCCKLTIFLLVCFVSSSIISFNVKVLRANVNVLRANVTYGEMAMCTNLLQVCFLLC